MTPINARSETVAEKPMFQGLLKRYRVVVPANGRMLWFAGLTGGKAEKNGKEYRSFTILTTSPNRKMEDLHDRMLVILSADDVEDWLDPVDEHLKRQAADLIAPLLYEAPDASPS